MRRCDVFTFWAACAALTALLGHARAASVDFSALRAQAASAKGVNVQPIGWKTATVTAGGQGLLVRFPRGSLDPASSIKGTTPHGGLFHRATLPLATQCAVLAYRVRFAPGFDFVKGGKLPGLGGGQANTGGRPPNGRDGFSVRLMWRALGLGELYAYVPGVALWGDSWGRGHWHFLPDTWYSVKLALRLNSPDQRDGEARLEVDGREVVVQRGVVYRTTADLKIDKLLLESFFGGNAPEWAASKDEVIELSDMEISQDGC